MYDNNTNVPGKLGRYRSIRRLADERTLVRVLDVGDSPDEQGPVSLGFATAGACTVIGAFDLQSQTLVRQSSESRGLQLPG